ncbi:VOC family protein [Brevibacillus brevis]|nr:VOC family protein [Brevibacillus brevis]UIO43914.1 VOC family protein [Brevibacillus brevis]
MAQSLLKGMEGVFIPVTDPGASAKWYEEKLGCRPLFDPDRNPLGMCQY